MQFTMAWNLRYQSSEIHFRTKLKYKACLWRRVKYPHFNNKPKSVFYDRSYYAPG